MKAELFNEEIEAENEGIERDNGSAFGIHLIDNMEIGEAEVYDLEGYFD